LRKKNIDNRIRLLKNESRLVEPGNGQYLRVVLLFPAPYEIAMANLGFQLIYSIFNNVPGVCCHRAFAPWTAFSQRISPDLPVPVTLETGEPLSKYDVVALSLNYENNILNVFRLLKAAGITLLSKDRSSKEPLIVAGGVVVTINPEPFADLVDICVLGEADELIPELCKPLITEWATYRNRKETLMASSEISGVYIPSFFEATYSESNQFTGISPLIKSGFSLQRRLVADLDSIPSSTVIHTKQTRFPELHVIEISRSCPRHCRFCLIPACYGKFRYRSVDSVINAAKSAPAGWRIGLLGAGAADHPQLAEICESLASKGYRFSFSSLHASSISDSLAEVIRRNGPKTITLAPEVATDKRRIKIGKSIRNEELIQAIRRIGRDPVKTIKTYFMIGLPGEKREDLEDIALFCKQFEDEIRIASSNETSIPRLSVGISCFVPKAQSPFERAPLNSEKYFKTNLRNIVSKLNKIEELSWTHDVPRWAVVQGLIARGNRQLIKWFIDSAEPGSNWRDLLKSNSCIDSNQLTGKIIRGKLPWEHLKTSLSVK